MKSYLLLPSITTLDLSHNRLNTLPPLISLHNYLAVLNLSHNNELEILPPELGLLDKLWSVGLTGCSLREPLKSVARHDGYKTSDVLSLLRGQLENSKPYPKMRLLLLGRTGVGKSTLLQMMRSEGRVTKGALQSDVRNLVHAEYLSPTRVVI